MKIGIVQFEAVKGNIEENMAIHLHWINIAVRKNVSLIVFPELSLTGYEIRMAKKLATNQNDGRFDIFQKLSNQYHITICAGVPTRNQSNVLISMIIFQPHTERITYSKRFLTPTEAKTFSAGTNPITFKSAGEIIAPAICYELSIPEHRKYAKDNQATVYMASVLNPELELMDDLAKLSEIAKTNHFITLMANYVGKSGGYVCAGKSSVWDTDGKLLGQLDGKNEGILIYDTVQKNIIK